ncbi:hypothetical protein CES85_5668 [Ochrobactrum quorumnocens]|uniref:Uncharacterized protein n=1 Tax=Ochrobactrum quorumnocens TaxID=271865 RepID=A0A248UDX9_9HYPH|nr:hypothetical protein [[Ochrobactrum] quorumnocens]ASV84864.1 hypothetical protein CES85_5668 [[Ochrobactrum] quorumnocens]
MIDRPLGLNHIETVHRPGDKDVARAVFEILGFFVAEFTTNVGGKDMVFLFASLDPANANGIDNVIYCSEVRPAQLALEQAMKAAIVADASFKAAAEEYRRQTSGQPQIFPHFGFSVPSLDDWEARVARVRDAAKNHPLLAGRIEIAGIYRLNDPTSVTPQTQAFIRTDAFSLGLLEFPVYFEIQYSGQEAIDTYRAFTPAGQAEIAAT